MPCYHYLHDVMMSANSQWQFNLHRQTDTQKPYSAQRSCQVYWMQPMTLHGVWTLAHTHTHRQTYHIISEKFNGSVNIAADYDPATLCTRHYDIWQQQKRSVCNSRQTTVASAVHMNYTSELSLKMQQLSQRTFKPKKAEFQLSQRTFEQKQAEFQLSRKTFQQKQAEFQLSQRTFEQKQAEFQLISIRAEASRISTESKNIRAEANRISTEPKLQHVWASWRERRKFAVHFFSKQCLLRQNGLSGNFILSPISSFDQRYKF